MSTRRNPPQIVVRVPEWLDTYLRTKAEEEGRSLSDITRLALELVEKLDRLALSRQPDSVRARGGVAKAEAAREELRAEIADLLADLYPQAHRRFKAGLPAYLWGTR